MASRSLDKTLCLNPEIVYCKCGWDIRSIRQVLQPVVVLAVSWTRYEANLQKGTYWFPPVASISVIFIIPTLTSSPYSANNVINHLKCTKILMKGPYYVTVYFPCYSKINDHFSLFWVGILTRRKRVQRQTKQAATTYCHQARAVFKQAIKMNYYQTHAETRPPLTRGIGSPIWKCKWGFICAHYATIGLFIVRLIHATEWFMSSWRQTWLGYLPATCTQC